MKSTDSRPIAADLAPQPTGSEAPEAAPESGARRSGQSIDSDDLVGLGELGLLPSLLQTLGTGIHCDFDDALSTCQ